MVSCHQDVETHGAVPEKDWGGGGELEKAGEAVPAKDWGDGGDVEKAGEAVPAKD